MKRKLILMTAILAIIGGCFVGCNGDKDDDMTTKPKNSTSAKNETSSNLADDISSGLSEAGSDVKKGVTNASEKMSEALE